MTNISSLGIFFYLIFYPSLITIFEKLDQIQCIQGWKTWKEHNVISFLHMRPVLSEQLVRDVVYIIYTKTSGSCLAWSQLRAVKNMYLKVLYKEHFQDFFFFKVLPISFNICKCGTTWRTLCQRQIWLCFGETQRGNYQN